MKKISLIYIFILLTSSLLLSQTTPQSFKFQGVARDNQEIITGSIGLQVSILKDSENGSVQYKERHFPETNDYGVFAIEIGSGTTVEGNFADIDWSTGYYYVKLELDPNGGANYTTMGTTKLLSVPYALYAENAGGDDPQILSLEGNQLSLDQDGGTVTLPDADPQNELQTLDLIGDQLWISDGNVVILPDVDSGNEIQNLGLEGTQLTIDNGIGVDLAPIIPPGGTDDQQISIEGDEILLEDGGSVTLPDADPENEIQHFTLDGTILTLENGNSVDLAPLLSMAGSDDQILELNGTVLSIEGGNSIDLAPLLPPGGTDDQTLEITDDQLSIEDGNTVTLPDADPENELQVLSKDGSLVTLSHNGGSFTDEVNDADHDPSNELQILSFNSSSNVLSISNGNSVTLNASSGGESYWNKIGNHIYYNGGDAGIDAGQSFRIGNQPVLRTNSNENLFVGTNAGINTTGEKNTFIGSQAGLDNASGNRNTFMGWDTGGSNQNGSENTFLGGNSGFNNLNGNENVFVGRSAGYYNVNGNQNTFLGRGAGTTSGISDVSKSVAIGYQAKVDCDNCMVLGGTGDDAVKVGIGTSNPTETLEVNGLIYSTFGGIKFPDGSVQTTAGGGGSLSLPYSGSANSSTYAFKASNTFTGNFGNPNEPNTAGTFIGSTKAFGVYAKGKTGVLGFNISSNNIGQLGGEDFGVKSEGDLVVEDGGFKGNIGPNNGAPFPRPAFDSGWFNATSSGTTINHNIGGDPENYVVNMIGRHNGIIRQVSDFYYVSFFADNTYFNILGGITWTNLTGTSINISNASASQEVRVRIWVIQ